MKPRFIPPPFAVGYSDGRYLSFTSVNFMSGHPDCRIFTGNLFYGVCPPPPLIFFELLILDVLLRFIYIGFLPSCVMFLLSRGLFYLYQFGRQSVITRLFSFVHQQFHLLFYLFWAVRNRSLFFDLGSLGFFLLCLPIQQKLQQQNKFDTLPNIFFKCEDISVLACGTELYIIGNSAKWSAHLFFS